MIHNPHARRVTTRHGPGHRPPRRRMLWTSILTLLVLVLSACSVGQEEAAAPEPSVAPSIAASPSLMAEASPSPMPESSPEMTAVAGAAGATLDEIVADPEAFYDQMVTVEGQVNVVQGDTSFTIADNTLTDASEVLVINPKPQLIEGTLDAQQTVRVSGMVRNFAIADINSDLDLDLDEQTYRDYDNTPVIVASTIDLIAGGADEPAAGTDEPAAGALTVAEIAAQPDAFVGQTVTVRGQIEELVGTTAFSMDENAAAAAGIDNDLLVVGGQPGTVQLSEANESESVEVMGIVRRFDLSAIEQEVGYALDEQLVSSYVGRPVIVAQSVTLIAPPAAEGSASPAATMEPGATATGTESAPAANLTVAELTSNVQGYLDQRVTVRSDVNALIGPNAFTLDEDAPFDRTVDRDLLVISGITGDVITEGVEVEVGGIVRRLDIAQIEQTTGRDLDDAALADYRDRPVIVANCVRAVPVFVAPDVEEAIQGAIQEADPAVTERYGATLTVAEVVGNLDELSGKAVAVRGSVQQTLGSRAVVLDEDAPLAGGIDSDLLVLSATESITVTEDDLVRAIGTVRTFDLPAIEQELGADLDDTLFAPYADTPVIVARLVAVNATPSAIAAQPSRYTDRLVTVLGEVEEVINLSAFTLDEDALLEAGIDDDLLVISVGEPTAAVEERIESRTVQVLGRVRPLVIAEIEREYSLDLDDQLVVEYEGRPAVIATVVQVVEE